MMCSEVENERRNMIVNIY